MKHKIIKIGTIKAPKSRDLVHLQEITHGTGAGAWVSKKDYKRNQSRKIEKEYSPHT